MQDTDTVQDDPLSAARVRAARVKANLLAAAGGALSCSEVAVRLQLSERQVDDWVGTGQLLALSVQGKWVVPACQIVGREIVPGLKEALKAFGDVGPWMRLAFFVSPAERLGHRKPIELLAEGRSDSIEQVAAAARGFGEQAG